MQTVVFNSFKNKSITLSSSIFTYTLYNMVYNEGGYLTFRSVSKAGSDGKFPESALPTILLTSTSKQRLSEMAIKFQQYGWGDSDTFSSLDKIRITLTDDSGNTSVIDKINVQDFQIIRTWPYYINRYFFDIINCVSIKIEFLSVVEGSKRADIEDIELSEYTEKGRLTRFKSFEIYENINILSDDVAVNTCNFSAVTPASSFLQENSEFDVIKGNSFYGRFSVSKCEQTDKKVFEISAEDMKSKAKRFKYDSWTTATSRTPELDIYNSSGLGVVNDFIASYRGFIENNNCLYALCQIAWALNRMIDSSRASFITLRDIPTEIKSYINNNNGKKKIIGNAKFTKSETFTQAKYSFKQYLMKYDAEKIGEFSAVLSEPTKYYFSEPPCQFSHVEPSSVIVSDTSDNYVELKTSGETESTISIYGYKYEPTTTEIIIKNTKDFAKNAATNEKIYDRYTLVQFDAYSAQGQIKDVKSPYIKKFIESPGTVSAKIVVENERVGDLVQIETAFSGTFTGIITSMVLHLGYTDVADIEIRVWPYEGGLG